MSKKVVIFGATSAIAQEYAKLCAKAGNKMLLVARNRERLEVVRDDLVSRGAGEVSCVQADLSNTDAHERVLYEIDAKLPDFDTVLVAYGTLGDQSECESDFTACRQVIEVNFVSTVALLNLLAQRFEKRKSGSIAVISSVAGDRGRKKNYIYGAAKGGLSIYLQGLRNRLASSRVQVLTIKPGFVDTPMTADFEKGPLFSSAEEVGRGIYSAIERGRDVVYLPSFWMVIMTVIKLIPERIFKKLNI